MKFSEVADYLNCLGLTNKEFNIDTDIENLEFYINNLYFCSVGRWDKKSFELFERQHGAEISEDGKDYLTDGELWQYKVYNSLKRTVDYAVQCVKNKKLPNKAIRKW